jgi:hypothetical protein
LVIEAFHSPTAKVTTPSTSAAQDAPTKAAVGLVGENG